MLLTFALFVNSGNDFKFGHREEVDDCAFSPLWAYADSLWVGESYNYHSNDADYWLVRMSGLNFGIFADDLAALKRLPPAAAVSVAYSSTIPPSIAAAAIII